MKLTGKTVAILIAEGVEDLVYVRRKIRFGRAIAFSEAR
jgi:hypothetical protein